jgi:Domain of unknown function (DUF4189)
LFFWIPLVALAEGNCPDGYYPIGGGNAGWEGCAAYEYAPGQQPPDTGPLWVKRWGAIAVDDVLGKFGGVDGFSSKGKAERAAVRQCKKNGGKSCAAYSYYNQCGALAWGDNFLVRSSGPLKDNTIAKAVEQCSAKSQNCKPYYAGCSYPERVR